MPQDPDHLKRSRFTSADVQSPVVSPAVLKDELLGTIYLGKYELNSVLGVGGMGVIYKGRQIFLDRPVAIKMLKNNLASVKARTRFHQEAKAASGLKHPGIVSIMDFGVDDLDRPYMVMEHVEGCTIAELLEERVTLTVEEILPVFLEICDALSAAHKKGIVHRDLKPANIMLVLEDAQKVPRIKILDFGIAKLLDVDEHTAQNLTKTGDSLGTPLYMSPEQVLGKNVTCKSDLYSVGCMMYTCLTGAPPFVGESKMATMDMHISDTPMSLHEASEGLNFPPGIEAIIMRLLQKDAAARYDSVDDLKVALIEMAVQNGFIEERSGFKSTLKTSSLSESGDNLATDVPDFDKTGHVSVSHFSAGSTGRSDASKTGGNAAKVSAGEDLDNTYSTQSKTTFWKSDLSDRVKAAQAAKFKSLPQREQPAKIEFDDVSSKVEASLNRTFAIVGGAAALVILSGVIISFAVLKPPVIPHPMVTGEENLPKIRVTSTTPPDIPDDTADRKIFQAVRQGALASTLSLKHLEGLSIEGMQALRRFNHLRNLDLVGTNMQPNWALYLVGPPLSLLRLDNNAEINDNSLSYLSKIPSLQHLSLAATGISDKGLQSLSSLPMLRSLWLGENRQLTEAALKNLAPQSSRIGSLFLNDCSFNDRLADELIKFRGLFSLDISNNPRLSDKALVILEQAKGLQFLIVACDHIGKQGIHAITKLSSLRVLDVSGIDLAPEAIDDLATMTNLSTLYVVNCHLTAGQIDKLARALPHTTIETNNRLSSRAR